MAYTKFSDLPLVYPSGSMFFPVVDLTETNAANRNKRSLVSDFAYSSNPVFTGVVTIPSGANIGGYASLTSPTFTGTVALASGATISGYATLNTEQTFTATKIFASGQTYPKIPQNARSSGYVLASSDAGKHISITTGGVTTPSGVFSTGDAISVYNNSGSNQTITQASGVVVRLAGSSSTGNRTLAQYGLCTLLCVADNVFVVSGAGLS